MRIAHFVQYYTPAIGGGVRFIAETGARLEERGHSVSIFTTNALNNDGFMSLSRARKARVSGAPREEVGGLRVHRYSPLIIPLLQDRIPFFRYGPITPSLLLEMSQASFDLIHTSAFPYAHNYSAYLLSRRRRLPLYVTPYYKPGQPVSRSLKKILQKCSRISTPVPWERGTLRRVFGIDAEKVDVVPSGVEMLPSANDTVPRTPYESPYRTISFIGRMTPPKGISHLLGAYRRHLLRSYQDLRLLVVGYVSEWARRSLLPKAGGNVVFTGPIWDKTELFRILATSEVLCYPSRDDCFPHVFLESWSVGTPVIGCKVGGVQDVIREGKDGLFVKFGDEKDLADAISFMLDNPREARRMGRRGKNKVIRRFTWDKVTTILEESYRHMLQDIQGATPSD